MMETSYNIYPIFEFILWDNCSNNCRFCWQKKQQNFLDERKKIDSIKKTIDFVNSEQFIIGSHVLLVGGELFEPQSFEVANKLEEIYQLIIQKQISNEICYLYINTNLLYKDISFLLKILNKLKDKNLLDRTKFTTSFDVYGRFSCEKSISIFKENIQTLKSMFKSELSIVVNSILTRQACNDIIENIQSNRCFFDNISKQHYYVNLIPYIEIDSDLSPSREELFKALNMINNKYDGYIEKNIKNLDLKQDKIIYRYVDGNLDYCSSKMQNCGHGINFSKYSLNKSCYICDVKNFFNL